jgi:hypothetical protein
MLTIYRMLGPTSPLNHNPARILSRERNGYNRSSSNYPLIAAKPTALSLEKVLSNQEHGNLRVDRDNVT